MLASDAVSSDKWRALSSVASQNPGLDEGLQLESTNIDLIDAEHRMLSDLLKEIREQSGFMAQMYWCKLTIDKLIAFAPEHFRTEEKMLEGIDGAGQELASHAKAHREIEQRLVDLYAQLNESDLTVPFQLVDLMEAWLTDHINRFDRKIANLVSTGLSRN